MINEEKKLTSHTPSLNYPDNLLSRHRINNPCQYQPGHHNEWGPENFLYLLILSEDGVDRVIRVCPASDVQNFLSSLHP